MISLWCDKSQNMVPWQAARSGGHWLSEMQRNFTYVSEGSDPLSVVGKTSVIHKNFQTNNMKIKFLCASICIALLTPAFSFQLSPVGTQAERKFAKRWGTAIRAEIAISESALHNFADPVHEALTQRIFGCDGDWGDCADPDLEYAGPYVIAGVRWNDDPVFMLTAGEAASLPCNTKDTVSFVTQTRCWVGLFRDAEKKASANPTHFQTPGKGNYLARSHFGDLQFLHAMASEDGEPASVTKAKILMWAQFTWGVVEGKYRLDTPLRDIEIEGWKTHFSNGHTVQDLFTLGRPWLRPHVKSMALGSLMHMVQDSFAAGHVERAEATVGQTCLNGAQPMYGRVSEFHSYAGQDHAKHKESDSNESARKHVQLNDPDVIDAGKRLRQHFDQQSSWRQVELFLSECVLPLKEDGRPASAGSNYSRAEK